MKIRIAALVLLLALLLAGCNFSLAADVTPPPGYQPPPPEAAVTSQATSGPLYPLVPPDPDKGAATYAEKCAACHGPTGMGDGPQAANLPNPVAALGSPEFARQAAPSEWYRVVTQGNLERFMPPFPSLNDRQRWDVVAYALTLSAPSTSVQQGAELYQAQCAECHGTSGRGDGPKATGSLLSFTDQERMAGQSSSVLFNAITNGAQGKMPAFGSLGEDQRWALVDYLRSLTFATKTAGPDLAGTPVPAEGPGNAAPVAATGGVTTTQPLSATGAVSGTVATSLVHGTVVNASGGEITTGLTVTLHSFDQMTLVMTDTTHVDNQGSFSFGNIPAPAGRAFLTTLEFGNVMYGSDVAQVETEGQPITLTMQVFETTTDQSKLSVDRLHYFFEFVNDQTLRVAELYIISNPGEKTVIGQGGPKSPVLSFMLPQGAKNLQFQEGALGERYIETPNGFADTIPIRPGAGNYQVLFSYEMPYNRKLQLSRPMPLPVQAVVILVPESGLKLSGPTLQDGGSRDVQGVQYHSYSGTAMEAGSTLDLTITGSASAGASWLSLGSGNNLLFGAAALGLALIAAGAWMFLRNRANQAAEMQAKEPEEAQPGETRESIMDAILALDDLYQDGKLPEEAYRKRRADLKDRLSKLMEN